MNNVFTAKLLNNLRNKKSNKGFTLIELLVVVIIIGVLAAVALPNLLGQVGKARESDAKTTVGATNRAQMASHIERQTFANAIDLTDAQNLLGVVVPANSIFAFTVTGDADDSTVTAAANNADDDGVRNYAGAASYAAGAFTTIVCQSDTVGGDAATTTAAACDDGTSIK
jgi:type IV pilus assembly protein PilA